MKSVVWRGIKISVVSPASNMFLGSIMDVAGTSSVSAALDWFAEIAECSGDRDIALDLEVCEKTVYQWRRKLGLKPQVPKWSRDECEMAVVIPAKFDFNIADGRRTRAESNRLNALKKELGLPFIETCSEYRCGLYESCIKNVRKAMWRGIHRTLPCENMLQFEMIEVPQFTLPVVSEAAVMEMQKTAYRRNGATVS